MADIDPKRTLKSNASGLFFGFIEITVIVALLANYDDDLLIR